MRTARKEKSQFSKQLIRLRQERDLTQQELAEALGFTRDSIAYYETKAENPTTAVVRLLADYFGVSPDVFGGEDQPKRERRGAPSKLERQLDQIRQLPKDKQKAISTVLDMALQNVAEQS